MPGKSWATNNRQFLITPGIKKLVVEKWDYDNKAWMPYRTLAIEELADHGIQLRDLTEVL